VEKLANTTGLQLLKYLEFRRDPLAWLYETRKLGDIVTINPRSKTPSYVIHRNEKLFPQPEEFQPSRFAKEHQSKIANYAYFPFGAGSRGCIGSQFVMMEAIAAVAQQYILRMAGENQEVQPEPLVSLRIQGGLPMKVIRR